MQLKAKLLKGLKWTIGIVMVLVIGISVMLYAFQDKICNLVLSELGKEFKEPVYFSKVDLTFWSTFPNLTVNVHDVKVHDAFETIPSKKVLLQSDRIRLVFNPIDLWRENYLHLPVAYPKRVEQERYLDRETLYQLTGEKKVYEFKGPRRIGSWKATRDRVEALDCFVYAYAALMALGPDVFSKLDDLAKKVAALTPEPDDVILEQQQTPQQQVPQFKPGLRLHNAKNTGFSIFRR